MKEKMVKIHKEYTELFENYLRFTQDVCEHDADLAECMLLLLNFWINDEIEPLKRFLIKLLQKSSLRKEGIHETLNDIFKEIL